MYVVDWGQVELNIAERPNTRYLDSVGITDERTEYNSSDDDGPHLSSSTPRCWPRPYGIVCVEEADPVILIR